MGRKNISLRSDVYEWLEAEKEDDESFSDAIARLLRESRDLDAGAGFWNGTGKAEIARETWADIESRIDVDESTE